MTPDPERTRIPPRRRMLATVGAALAASALAGESLTPTAPAIAGGSTLRRRPNFLLIVTDQERYPRFWPAGWADTNLPNRKRIADRGLSFSNAYCNACMCSPSRSTLFTGAYPAQHGVTATLTSGGTQSASEPQLAPTFQNMAGVLASAGYEVHYRGKWHMSKGAGGGKPTATDVAGYGFQGWVAPDAGEDTAVENFGGGTANNDAAYAQQAIDFLAARTPTSTASQPFALVVSFVNPHDLLAYPRTVNDDAVYAADPNKFSQGILYEDVPTRNEDLSTNNKPTAHAQTLALLAAGLGVLAPLPALDRRNYVNFYAYLHKVIDVHIGAVLDALEAQGLWDSTVVIRTADHGELGLSHGGLRQKMFNAYQETINIPLVIANPVLFSQPTATTALGALVDLLPTMAELAEVPPTPRFAFKGHSLTPVLANASASVQDAILFTFDDEKAGAENGQSIVTQPNHIRCMFDGRWKYARYFDPSGAQPEQYELYDVQSDPYEMNNLASSNTVKRAEMAAKLAALEAERLSPLYRAGLPSVIR